VAVRHPVVLPGADEEAISLRLHAHL
jgi:hypothetical protein